VIVRLATGTRDRYALAFQCRPDVEKAVLHGGRAWAVSLIPLSPGENLEEDKVRAVRSLLAGL
jgi:hypothetical protein